MIAMTEPPELPDDIEFQDLRRAAIHEAAHAVVALSFGFFARASIFRNPNPDALADLQRTWVGRCEFSEEAYFDEAAPGRPITSKERRLIALAGTVAEEFSKDHETQAWEILEWLECDIIALSVSDAAAASPYDEHHIDTALALVRKLWAEITSEADSLVSFALADEEDTLPLKTLHQNQRKDNANFGRDGAVMLMARECRG